MFHDRLNEYITRLGCSGRELAEASGLSPATISRYRGGERRPESEAERAKLISGIARLAERRGVPALTEEAVAEGFRPFFPEESFDAEHLRAALNTLLTTFSISVSDLARSTNYDASYLSRVRSGQRRPADPERFIAAVAEHVLRRCDAPAERDILAELTGAGGQDEEGLYRSLVQWLGGRHGERRSDVSAFLKQLDGFDLNAYIRTIHFDELKVPTAPFQLPLSKTYYGLEEMRAGELDFLKATVLGRSLDPVFLCSDMPMDDMAQDEDFKKKYMFGLAMLLKKGLHLNVVHNLDRPFPELMLGLQGWIPLYMTGQISPYYLKHAQDNVFLHLLKVSGAAALTGEAIAGHHSQGRYYLTKSKREVEFYARQAQALLERAEPLMEIYRSDRAHELSAFLLADAGKAGKRRGILSSPPLYTMAPETLAAFLDARQVDGELQAILLSHAAAQRQRMAAILETSEVVDELSVLSQGSFDQHPPVLDVSGAFCESDLCYTYPEYLTHLRETERFAACHPNYTLKRTAAQAFRNLQIFLRVGQWAMVSKGKAPAIHFVIRHPRLREALERFIPPVVE